MRVSIVQKLAAVIVAVAALSGTAIAGDWQIVKTSGQVSLSGATPVSLKPADSVPDGATVVTGKDGRVQLAHGADFMVIGPNSVVTMPKASGALTTVQQSAGEVSFDVEKQAAPHFAVETPFLAAIVKGTEFIVTVSPDSALVNVSRGLVEVANVTTGEVADVAAGQGAAVSLPNGGLLTTTGGVGGIRRVAPRGSPVAPMTVAELDKVQAISLGLTPVVASGSLTETARPLGVVAALPRNGGGNDGSGGDVGPSAGGPGGTVVTDDAGFIPASASGESRTVGGSTVLAGLEAGSGVLATPRNSRARAPETGGLAPPGILLMLGIVLTGALGGVLAYLKARA